MSDAVVPSWEGVRERRIARLRRIDAKLVTGADVMSYDAATNHLWIVTGGKNAAPKMARSFVNELDAATGAVLGSIPFDTDFTEGIAAEQKGNRIFVNLAGRSEIAVTDPSETRTTSETPLALQMSIAWRR